MRRKVFPPLFAGVWKYFFSFKSVPGLNNNQLLTEYQEEDLKGNECLKL